MADNLKILKANLDQAIDPNAGIGEILAQNHNDVFTEFINKSGKYTGLTYQSIFEGLNDVIPTGTFSWNGNAMNQSGDFVITFSIKTTDLNDVSPIIDNLVEGDIIKFKDFVGRSCLLKYKQHSFGVDTVDGDVCNMVVNSLPGNTNYTYQQNENESCVLDFYPKSNIDRIYTIDIVANELKLYENGVEVVSKDLSVYLDDTNLARLVSGTVTNGILTVTRDDATTFDIDLTDLLDNGIILGNSDQNDAGNGTVVVNLTAKQISAYENEIEFFDNPSQNTTVLRFGSFFKNNILRVADANGVPQFILGVNDTVELKGGTFDVANKRWSVDALQYNTYFIKSDGNDSTGELNNSNKPFATLNGAVSHYKSNSPQPSGSFYSNYIFEILDGATYTLTQTLFRSFSTTYGYQAKTPVLTIKSNYACVVNCSNPNTGTTLVLMHNENNVRHVFAKLIIDIKNGEFNLTGSNAIQICPTSNSSFAVLDMNVNEVTKSAIGNGLGRISQNDRTGISTIKINNTIISNTGLFSENFETNGYVDFGNITISANATIVNNLNFKEFGFNKIAATSDFTLCNQNRGTIRHGDIDASAVGSQIRYINGHANVDYDAIMIYKDNCKILGNLYIHGFNSGKARYKLYGNDVYYQSSYVFYHEDVPVGGIGIEVNVRRFECENDFIGGLRPAVGVKLVNCYFKVGGYFNRGIVNSIEARQWDISGEEYKVLVVDGTCVIDADVVDGSTVIQNLNNPATQGNAKMYINGDLLMIKGTIDFTNIDLIKEATLNRY